MPVALVTGAHGFIGRHLGSWLVGRDYRIGALGNKTKALDADYDPAKIFVVQDSISRGCPDCRISRNWVCRSLALSGWVSESNILTLCDISTRSPIEISQADQIRALSPT